jgi:hypothetical protein
MEGIHGRCVDDRVAMGGDVTVTLVVRDNEDHVWLCRDRSNCTQKQDWDKNEVSHDENVGFEFL